MRCLLFIALVACRFEPARVEPPDATFADAPPAAACGVAPTQAPVSAGAIGSDGGTQREDIRCPDGELPIGVELDTTANELPNFNNEQVVVAIHVRCGRIERTPANVMTTIPSGRISRLPDTCAGFSPTTASGELQCPAGAAIVGVRGNNADGNNTSYNSVKVICAALATDGSVTAATTTLDYPLTGSYSNQLQEALCPAGSAAVTFGIRSGCSQDELEPRCAPLSCTDLSPTADDERAGL
jgi:hypothetical protein